MRVREGSRPRDRSLTSWRHSTSVASCTCPHSVNSLSISLVYFLSIPDTLDSLSIPEMPRPPSALGAQLRHGTEVSAICLTRKTLNAASAVKQRACKPTAAGRVAVAASRLDHPRKLPGLLPDSLLARLGTVLAARTDHWRVTGNPEVIPGRKSAWGKCDSTVD